MAIFKTIGGDRLGSGKRMKAELKAYERSTHNRGYLWRTTGSAGTLIPFLVELALPGDTLDIDLDCDIKTHPTLGPLFGSYKAQLDIFGCPIRLYQGKLHNNATKIGMNMKAVKLPQIRLTAYKTPRINGVTPRKDLNNGQINPSCILAYLGIRGVGYVPDDNVNATEQRLFNGLQYLSYWDIVKNYYTNKQEEIGAVVQTEMVAIVDGSVDSGMGSIQTPIGSAGVPYPIAGFGTTSIPLTNNTKVIFPYTAPIVPIANQLIMTMDTGQEIPFSEACGPITDTGAQLEGVYNWAKYGNNYTATWRYRTPDELPAVTPSVKTFPLTNLDVMRDKILEVASSTNAFIVNDQFLPGAVPIEPYCLVLEPKNGTSQMMGSQQGLAIKTYQSDLFNNWLQTTWIDGPNGITALTAIDTSGGSFTIDTLNLSRKVYDYYNRIAISGGTYQDWLQATYTHEANFSSESPIYFGGLSKELIFQEVVSNSESQGEGGNVPLGTLAGKGTMASKHKGGKVIVKCDEPMYVLGIFSLTPRIDYSQGNSWDTHLETMDDFHKPALDEIGFQELITEQMAWWDTTFSGTPLTWTTKSAGKQPAWINYMTQINRVYGNFAVESSEMFMTLNRRYEPLQDDTDQFPTIKDLTTYIDPVKYNQIFAETAGDAQNFWIQIAVDNIHRRKMSAKIMPNL